MKKIKYDFRRESAIFVFCMTIALMYVFHDNYGIPVTVCVLCGACFGVIYWVTLQYLSPPEEDKYKTIDRWESTDNDRNKKSIADYLQSECPEKVERFRDYCNYLATDKKSGGELKNPWIRKRTQEQLAKFYKKVALDGLEFDGVHITLQSTGVSYDYIAYKNLMYKKYPESIIDVQLVYKGDEFNFGKESGVVSYSHQISNPFEQEDKDIIGGYCVIKNKRGQFLTLLSNSDIAKHRKVAKTDYIWKSWFKEMALKTIIKKACKTHFADVYQNVETLDNENYDLDKIKPVETISESQLLDLTALIEEKGAPVEKITRFHKVDKWEDLTVDQYPKVIEMIEAIE